MNKQGKSQFTETLQQALMFLEEVYKNLTGKDPKLDLQGFEQFINLLLQKTGIKDTGQFLDAIYLQATSQQTALAQPTLQQVAAARHGAKLQYVKSLKHQCAEDEELYYFKRGGKAGCGCRKKDGGEIEKALNGTAVDKFKKARAINTGKHLLNGAKETVKAVINAKNTTMWHKMHRENAKRDSIAEKDYYEVGDYSRKGEIPKKDKCGGKVKKHENGGGLTAEEIARLSVLDWNKFAPRAEWRYQNGTRRNSVDDDIRYADNSSTRAVVGTGLGYGYVYPTIVESVISPGDTLYVETPELKRFSLRGFPTERRASTKNPNGKEYEILKRRFNTAWNISK